MVPQGQKTQLAGWGRTAPTIANVVKVQQIDEVEDILQSASKRGVVARGMGRSYGDAAQNAGGTVVSTLGISNICDFDEKEGVVTVQSGMTLGSLLDAFAPRGWIPTVLPGTRHVTVGGAIAADIHGKNQHRVGTFGDHTTAFTLCSPAGVVAAGAKENSEVSSATAGGMGMTGIVLKASIRMRKIESPLLTVDTQRAPNLEVALAEMGDDDARYEYSVAWLDCLAGGSHLGRAVLTRANHATGLPAQTGQSANGSRRRTVGIPIPLPKNLLTRATLKAFNEAWYRKAPRSSREHPSTFDQYFFPLDRIEGWNRLYGDRGFIQYQFVVPFGAETLLQHFLEEVNRLRLPASLGVLKRFGNSPSKADLGFALPGWTLAVDIAVGHPQLAAFLDDFDVRLAEAGGRVYLAKDARLRPDVVRSMYPKIDRWEETCANLDPSAVMKSDLGRRLELTKRGR